MPRPKRKRKAKKLFRVFTPPYLGFKEVGTVLATGPEHVIGRTVEITFYEVTGDFQHQNIKLKLQILKVEGDEAYTDLKTMEYMREFLRSLVRRRTSMVDAVIDLETKDGYKIRAMAIAFTTRRITSSRKRAIRKVAFEILKKRATELVFKQFIHEALLGKIASEIYNEGKKIYPLRFVGVRKIKVLRRPEDAIDRLLAEKPVKLEIRIEGKSAASKEETGE